MDTKTDNQPREMPYKPPPVNPPVGYAAAATGATGVALIAYLLELRDLGGVLLIAAQTIAGVGISRIAMSYVPHPIPPPPPPTLPAPPFRNVALFLIVLIAAAGVALLYLGRSDNIVWIAAGLSFLAGAAGVTSGLAARGSAPQSFAQGQGG